MKKVLFSLMILVALVVKGYGQDEAVFNHYYVNPLLINPATTGFEDNLHRIFFNGRSQWAGFPGAPQTYSVSYNGPVGKQLGLGVMAFTETIAQLNRLRAQASMAYKVNVDKFKVALGVSLEYHQLRLDSEVTDNPFYEQGDDLLTDAMDGVNVFDASVGIYGTFAENTFFGASLPYLVQNRLDNIGTDEENNTFFQYYLFFLGHRFVTTNNFTLEPSVLLKNVRNAPFQADFNLRGLFLDSKLVTGISYRTGSGGSMALLLGTKLKVIQLYYSYDIYLDDFQKYNGGSHEITLGFDIVPKGGEFDRAKKYRK